MMGILVLVWVATVASFTSAQRPGQTLAPYTVVRVSEHGYEERQYPALTWACFREVTQQAIDTSLYSKSYLALASYFNGRNEGGRRMKMALPVTVMVWRKDALTHYEMCFLLPATQQAQPPRPEERSISVVRKNPMTVLARSWQERVEGTAAWDRVSRELQERLKAGNENGVDFSRFIAATFNSPFEADDFRNEVWYAKSSQG